MGTLTFIIAAVIIIIGFLLFGILLEYLDTKKSREKI